MAGMYKKFLQNQKHYDSAVRIGKSLLELTLSASDPRHLNFKDKLGMSDISLKKNFSISELEKLEECDVSLLYKLDELDASLLLKLVHLLCHLDEKDPELHKNLNILKDSQNINEDSTKFTDLFIWQKIEELRNLFIEILGRINNLYSVDVSDKSNEINKTVDKILGRVEVTVSELNATEFMNQLKAGIKSPCSVKVEIKGDPKYCFELGELLETLGKENIRIKLFINKAYFDGAVFKTYNSKKHLLPLLNNSSRCKLVWYRGNLNMEMIDMLPSTLEQLYIRVMPNQIESLNNQFNKFSKLWSLALYLDFSEPSNADPFHLDTVDPASLPVLKYKGKQLGLRICACITVSNFPWIIELIKRLTKEHQCDTLEFYRTRLNTGHEIEALLRALHDAEVHVTTWIKVENMEDRDENRREEEMRLSIVAKNLFLGDFKFLAPWK